MSSFMIAVFTVIFALIGPLSTAQAWAKVVDTLHGQEYQTPTAATAIVLAIDTSSYMDGYSMRKVQEAAHQFVEKVDSATSIAIVSFADTARLAQAFTQDKAVLLSVLGNLKPHGVRALYDGTVLAINTAASVAAPHRAVVLMSNGPDYRYQSKATRNDALNLAKTRGIPVYTVGVGTLFERAYFKELAQISNAESFGIERVDSLVSTYTTLSARLIDSPTIPSTPAPAVVINSATIFPVMDVADRKSPVITPTISSPKQKLDVTTAIVLAIDTSNNMTGIALRKAKEAARSFVEKVDPNTPIAVVTFGNKAEVAKDFTSDKSALVSIIDGLKTGGNRALYDGSLAAVNLAGTSAAQRRMVILLSNGAEYRYQSKSTRQDAIALAKNRSVAVYTIALGNEFDRVYLRDLALAANGQNLTAKKADELVAVYTTLSAQFADPLLASNKDSNDSTNKIPGSMSPADGADTAQAVGSKPIVSNGIVVAYDPKPGAGMKSPGTTPADLPPISPIAPAPGDLTTNGAAAGQVDASTDTTDPISSSIMPINIAVPGASAISNATLDINGHVLANYNSAPYEYDLDTRVLSAGAYTLNFTVTNDKQVTSKSSLDFDVVVKVDNNTTDPKVGDKSAQDSDILNGKPRRTTATVLDSARRVLLVNGKAVPFDLSFTPETGLVLIEHKPAVAGMPTESLTAILTKPANLLPLPVKEALLAQHPTFWSIVVLIMTIILLPQGLFTMYWMLYTWNRPDLADKYRSPSEYVAPQHSFTAIIPARHEAAVIKDTIRTVDRIDYPDHLKEILVMVRDDDDDETIAAAREAITEIGKDSIKLITFTTGPKNKPNGLNRGLKAASKDVICVFDAEDEPHPELYNVVNTVMLRDDADVVQSGVQLMNFKSTWFSALNCLEYFFWFKSGLHCFTHALKVTPLGGNTVFFKKHWLQRINGWDEHCLTEDADVGIRLTKLGAKIQVVYDEKHATQEETPHNVESFIKQRTRWCQGFYEIFFKGDWLKLPLLKQKITAIYILLNSVLQAALMVFLPLGLYIALTQRVPMPIALISYFPIVLLFMQLCINLVGIREFTAAYKEKLPFGFSASMAIFYYPFQLLLAFSAFRAIRRFLSRKNAWEKTAHSNLHRQPTAQVQL